jgi:hypothetical protein
MRQTETDKQKSRKTDRETGKRKERQRTERRKEEEGEMWRKRKMGTDIQKQTQRRPPIGGQTMQEQFPILSNGYPAVPKSGQQH